MTDIIQCKTPTIPTAKKYRETQYSTRKLRSGRISVPFLGLESGTHRIRFYNKRREATLTVKTWECPYGYAWRVVKDIDGEVSDD